MPPTADIPAIEFGQKRDFALWSRSYDESPNPMLSLEQRFLAPILPDIVNRGVLDIGCGTGRWLQRLAESSPRTLTGIDFSAEMLEYARQKLGGKAVLAMGNATSLPVANASADVVLASFVTSYIVDLPAFAAELRRVLRTGGKAYISDVHPETALACGWKRGFRIAEGEIELSTHRHSLSEIVAHFQLAGFTIKRLLEPPFGAPEFETFRRADKLVSFHAAAGLPAIYILELESEGHCTTITSADHSRTLTLASARITLDAQSAKIGDLEIATGRVSSISTSRLADVQRPSDRSDSVDLDGYLLLPGLINAHDHLEFSLYPNLRRGPYQNSAQWAKDIQSNESATIATNQSVPRDVRLWWGAIRNLLCGVTTVCHHNPLHPELLADDFPVRVVTHYGWAHSLAMDAQLEANHRSTPDDAPFVLHACEGVDESSAAEVGELDRRGVLDERTVLVHGLALNAADIALLNASGATLVWCPSSNRFLFGRTLTRDTIASVHRVLLGSDSPLTAAGDLLDEIRFAHRDVGIPTDRLFRMIFDSAPTSFRLRDGQGRIDPGATADFIAVRDTGVSPAEALVDLTTADIELVIIRGRVQLASEQMWRRLPANMRDGLCPLEIDSLLRWIRAPLARLFAEAQRVLGCDLRIGGKRVRHVSTAWL